MPGCVRVGVVEDVERPFAGADLDLERLGGRDVGHCRGPGDSREREPSAGSGVVLRVPSPRLAKDGEPPSCLLAIPVGHAAVREHSTLKAAVK